MNGWKLIPINKKQYDFRLLGKPKEIDYSLSFWFQALAILSLKLTKGVFKYKNEFYQFIGKITQYEIIKSKYSNKYSILNQQLSRISIYQKNKDTQYFEFIPSNYNFEIDNMFYNLNKPDQIGPIEDIDAINDKIQYLKYPVFTGIMGNNGEIIVDIPQIDYQKNQTKLIRFQFENFRIEFSKGENEYNGPLFGIYSYETDIFLKLTPLEYQILVYRSILAPKFTDKELNQVKNKIDQITEYQDNKGTHKGKAVAIDPKGSKDRDDAISALETEDNITLWVHISDVSPFLNPIDHPYHYYFAAEKITTDYFVGGNSPLLDRRLSDQGLSLNGKNKRAVSVEITYKIKSKKEMEIYPLPIKIEIFRSQNLEITPTSYYDFAHSFNKKPEKGYANYSIKPKKVIDCIENIHVNHPEIFNEGKSNNRMFNNLKRLYIYFRNSLPEANRDSVLLGYDQFTYEKKLDYLILDALPTEQWAHQLIEFTALQANSYVGYAMLALQKYPSEINYHQKAYHLTADNIISLRNNLNKDYRVNKLIFQGKKHDKKQLTRQKFGIFRNLVNGDHFLSDETANFFIRVINQFSDAKLELGKIGNEIAPVRLANYLIKNPKAYRLIQNNFKLVRQEINQGKLALETDNIYYVPGLLDILASLRLGLIYQAKDEFDLIYDGITPRYVMRSDYQPYPVIHHDIASYCYTHFTSPMRRFVDVNVHHLLFNRTKSIKKVIDNLSFDKINNKTSLGRKFRRGFDQNFSVIKYLVATGEERKGKLYLPKIKIKMYPNSSRDIITGQKLNDSVKVVIKEFKSNFTFPKPKEFIKFPTTATISLNKFGTMEIIPLTKKGPKLKLTKRLDMIKTLMKIDKNKDKRVKRFLSNKVFKLNYNRDNPFPSLNLNKCFTKKKSKKGKKKKRKVVEQYGGGGPTKPDLYYKKYLKYKVKYLKLKELINE